LALGIADRVVFAGFRSDVPDCLAAMDVVVHPSETEAFCQAIVEAMAAGKPVVATDVAAASEVIENGTTGLLIPPRDPEAIVHAVMTLYGAPERIASIAASAEKSVRARFGISRMIDAQIALYEAAYRRGE
jgi:glycosyltransferase involved in cell wall biosynthesis